MPYFTKYFVYKRLWKYVPRIYSQSLFLSKNNAYNIPILVVSWFLIFYLLYRIKDVKWNIKDGTLHHILPIYNSGVEVTSYDSKTGNKFKTRRVSAPFITQETE